MSETSTAAKADKKTEAPASDKIHASVREVADRYIKAIGNGDSAGDEFFMEELKSRGHTPEALSKLADDVREVNAGVVLGFGEVAIKRMAKKNDLGSVSDRLKTYGGGHLDLYMARENVGRNPSTGETVVSHGRVAVGWVTTADGKRGQMGVVLTHLKEIGAKSLASKKK